MEEQIDRKNKTFSNGIIFINYHVVLFQFFKKIILHIKNKSVVYILHSIKKMLFISIYIIKMIFIILHLLSQTSKLLIKKFQ